MEYIFFLFAFLFLLKKIDMVRLKQVRLHYQKCVT